MVEINLFFFFFTGLNVSELAATMKCAMDTLITSIYDDGINFLTKPNAVRTVMVFVLALIVAYWLSRFLAQAIVWVAQKIAVRSDSESNDARVIRLRQVETYLSIATAIARALAVAIVGYITWRLLNPLDATNISGSAAAIGAGAFFIVIAGQTVGIILRDLTAGSIMITEGWFKIGDFIKIEPFWDVAGVVERFTLRSTRIRSLSGEIIWVHNQHITGVHVTPRGVRTMAVEVFVVDKERGEKAINKLISAIPSGTMMLAKPLKIVAREKWESGVWRITVVGQTPPGRDWLIQDYFVEAVKALDKGKKRTERLLANAPFARFADPDAERKFNRAVRVARDK